MRSKAPEDLPHHGKDLHLRREEGPNALEGAVVEGIGVGPAKRVEIGTGGDQALAFGRPRADLGVGGIRGVLSLDLVHGLPLDHVREL